VENNFSVELGGIGVLIVIVAENKKKKKSEASRDFDENNCVTKSVSILRIAYTVYMQVYHAFFVHNFRGSSFLSTAGNLSF